MQPSDAAKKVQAARTALILEQPFFGALALKLIPVETTAHKTFATDGVHLMFNPDYVAKLTPHEVRGVICHEVLH
ncbi:MAG TPA: hypothetical protein VEF04_17940, partial [Blastocatellia bacterium]|nr:hypothetical protein [Blastocatellia bacterium]